jgi:putative thioredoxin
VTAVVLSDDPAERVAQLRAELAAHPGRESLKLDLALAVLATGDVDEAAQLLEALPAALYAEGRAVRARARVALLHRLATADAAHAVPMRAILEGDAAAGIAALIELMRDERHDEHGLARAALVEAFGVIEDDALVRESRRRMASVLF